MRRRLWRASIGCALVAVDGAAAALSASTAVVLQPGDVVSVDGTHIACLAFGANVPTLRKRGPGIFCARATVTAGVFRVMRGSQATLYNSYVYALVPGDGHDAQLVLGTPLPPRSTPRRQFRLGLGDSLSVRGGSFACNVFRSE